MALPVDYGTMGFAPPADDPPPRRWRNVRLVLLAVGVLGLTTFLSFQMLFADVSAAKRFGVPHVTLDAARPESTVHVETMYVDELKMHSDEYNKYLANLAFQPATLYEHSDFDTANLQCIYSPNMKAVDDHPSDACVKAYKCCTGPKLQCNPTFTPNYGMECRSCIANHAQRYTWHANQKVGERFAEACWLGAVDACRMVCPRFQPVGEPAHDYCLDCLVQKAVAVKDWGLSRKSNQGKIRSEDEFAGR